MRGGARLVRELGVGCQLAEPLGARPRLAGRHEGPADAAPSEVGCDVPPFQVRHGARLAPFRPGAAGDLGEPYEGRVVAARHERRGDVRELPPEECAELREVLSDGSVGPEPVAQAGPRLEIVRLGGTDDGRAQEAGSGMVSVAGSSGFFSIPHAVDNANPNQSRSQPENCHMSICISPTFD